MNRKTTWLLRRLLLGTGAVSLTFALTGTAQVQTEENTTHGTPTKVTTVEKGQVVAVSGNDLVVKMADGSLRHFANVPESTRVDVDGQELGIHDLKPGMTLQRTITTTTTPKVITTTKSVTGTVWQVQPPTSVILRLDDGTNQSFKIPRGQKFNVDGQMTDAWGLKKGMKVSATKVVEEPITQVQREAKISGQMPPPPPPPPADAPILVVLAVPEPAPPTQTAEAAPAALPKTASELPLIGMLGLFSLLLAMGLRAIRKAA